MNLDLFADDGAASPVEYGDAMAAWLVSSTEAGQLQRESSTDVYECWRRPKTEPLMRAVPI